MNPRSSYNFRCFFRFYLLLSLSLTVMSGGVFTDMLLLRMNFNLEKFGAIKCGMYFFPALCYWFAAPYLQRLNQDRMICTIAFGARILLPLPLPFLPLLTQNQYLLLWACFAVYSVSMTCALFGNNSLMMIFKGALDGPRFNRMSALLNAVFGLPCALAGIPLARWLGNMTDDSDADFFWAYGILQLTTALAAPAALVLLHRSVLRVDRTGQIPVGLQTRIPGFCERLVPFFDAAYRPILCVGTLQSIWLGALSAYVVVYLLKNLQCGAFKIQLLESGLAVAVVLIASLCGTLADRHGYGRAIGWGTLLLLACLLPFAMAPGVSWCVWLMLLCGYNNNTGILSAPLRILVSFAAARRTGPGFDNIYVAAFSLCQLLGSFVGSLLAGWLWELLAARVAEPDIFPWIYRIFMLCGLLLIYPAFRLDSPGRAKPTSLPQYNFCK